MAPSPSGGQMEEDLFESAYSSPNGALKQDDSSMSVFEFANSDNFDTNGYETESDEGDGRDGDDAARSSEAPRIDSRTEVEKLAEEETKRVRIWRMIVLIGLLLAGAVVSTCTYIFLTNEERANLNQSYDNFATVVKSSCTDQLDDVVYNLRTVGETISASCMRRGEDMPYCTVPDFEVEGKHSRVKSGILVLFYMTIIENTQVEQWNDYSVANQGWIQESHGTLSSEEQTLKMNEYHDGEINPYIYETDAENNVVEALGPGPFAPIWQMSPPPFDPSTWINYNSFFEFPFEQLQQESQKTGAVVMSGSKKDLNLERLDSTVLNPEEHLSFHKQFVENVPNGSAFELPHCLVYHPIYRNATDRTSILPGFVVGVLPWDILLANVLPAGVKGMVAVLKNSCGESYTYIINGEKVTYSGVGDHHDEDYDMTRRTVQLLQVDGEEKDHMTRTFGSCKYEVNIYQSEHFEVSNSQIQKVPLIFSICVAFTFCLMTLVFNMYDSFVRKRNRVVLDAAERSNAILSSLFPTNIRERLFAEKERPAAAKNNFTAPKSQLKSFLVNGEFMDELQDGDDVDDDDDGVVFKTKPIADLFAETTILFADISGFTAWSSVREPSQVFILLETLYHAFDEIAKKRRVFKVETVGDCYVAVTGLPDPQKDHAVVMARFARECMFKTRFLTKRLEVNLGPDTGELAMRMGLHSGPVTAGVLRGERSRFQLFGDTMNTAARMEQTGIRDRIQISEETADLLVQGGKSGWIKRREDRVVAKGKGEMQTYWLVLGSEKETMSNQSVDGDEIGNIEIGSVAEEIAGEIYDGKTARLIDWNVDVLIRLLKQIAARRLTCPTSAEAAQPNEKRYKDKGRPVMDEVKEIITLPKFNAKIVQNQEDPERIELGLDIVEQLHDFVCNIAALYRDNPFHSFEHASHVTMSVVKLLSRIVAPSDIEFEEADNDNILSTLHDHTYGITSDPLTQFACVFSALIHDLDHPGVPNSQLVKENTKIASYYKNKSVAEQNSVDLAWSLLMDENYVDLRGIIYTTDSELRRFRQLVVNSVMATDIVDKELKTLRNLRWDRAFAPNTAAVVDANDTNRKATIVIEHLIQASDVAHTMQHWHIYRKWNERLFFECYRAYKAGRADRDPSLTWYQGELDFFEFYIIPLAKKLKDCGVFGVSSDEYLNYAVRNRQEWEERGRDVLDEMIEQVSHEQQMFAPLEKP